MIGGFRENQSKARMLGKFEKEFKEMVFDDFRDLISLHVEKNLEFIRKSLSGINWAVNNPGRQWTSSYNPEIVCATDFYGKKFYTPIYTILDEKVETMLRCARSFDEKCVWYKIPKDVFNLIIKALAFLPISENTSSKITSLLSKDIDCSSRT